MLLPSLAWREEQVSLELLALQPGRRPPLEIRRGFEPTRPSGLEESGPVDDGVSLALEPIRRSIAR